MIASWGFRQLPSHVAKLCLLPKNPHAGRVARPKEDLQRKIPLSRANLTASLMFFQRDDVDTVEEERDEEDGVW